MAFRRWKSKLLFIGGSSQSRSWPCAVCCSSPTRRSGARLRRPDRRVPVRSRVALSPWDWGQYHAGDPRPEGVADAARDRVLAVAGIAAVTSCRAEGPRELAALTAAILIGFELVPHPLVIPLHPVVPALRAARADAAREEDMSPWMFRIAVVAVVASISVGLAVAAGVDGKPGIVDTPIYRSYGERIVGGECPTGLCDRVPAGGADPLRPACSRHTRPGRVRLCLCVLDGSVARRTRAPGGDLARHARSEPRAGRRRRRSRPGGLRRARAVRPQPLRPVRRGDHPCRRDGDAPGT